MIFKNYTNNNGDYNLRSYFYFLLFIFGINFQSQTIKNIDSLSLSKKNYYSLETMTMPLNIAPEIGAIKKLADGRLVVAFHSGEICFYDPETKQWFLYAEGLHEPLGIVLNNSNDIVVIQRPELTRVIDRDKDGIADFYQTITDQFGISGNYHEFNFGGIQDKKSNYYISLNVASHFAPIWKEVRGIWSEIGLSRKEFYKPWNKNRRDKAGRMFARVAYRGWVLKVSPSGKVTPIASGFRSPNGLGIDNKGNILVTDNQGDWVPTSSIYHLKNGHFYGHPASLIWEENWPKIDPLKILSNKFNVMRTRPCAVFPQGEYANSPTEILFIEDNRMGNFIGQWLVGEMNYPRLLRYIPDKIGEEMQGTILIHIEDSLMGRGNHRLVWGQSNDLWIGKIHLKWAGLEGLKRITFHNINYLAVKLVKLVGANTFRISFTHKLSSDIRTKQINISSFNYSYWKKYGSPKRNIQSIKAIEIKKINDYTYDIYTSALEEKKYYEISIDKKAVPIEHNRFVYTANRLPNLIYDEKKDNNYVLNSNSKLKKWWVKKNKLLKISQSKEIYKKNKNWNYLFNGTLESAEKNFLWKTNKWIVQNKALIIKRKKGFGNLITRKSYSNFILELEVKFNSKSVNSGIFYLSQNQKRFEFQICDNFYKQEKIAIHRMGSLYDIMPNPYRGLVKQDKWNKIRIVVNQGIIEHYLNDALIFSVDIHALDFQQRFMQSKYYKGKIDFNKTGKIVFQDHGDTDMSFRKVRIFNL